MSSNSFQSKGKIVAWRKATQIRSALANKDVRQLSLVVDFLNLPSYRIVLAMAGAFSWENYLRSVFRLVVITSSDLLVKIKLGDSTLPGLTWADDQFRTVSRLVQVKLKEHVTATGKVSAMIMNKFVLGPICNTYGLDIDRCLTTFDKAGFEKHLLPYLDIGLVDEYNKISQEEDDIDGKYLLVDYVHRLFSLLRVGGVKPALPKVLPSAPPKDYYTSSQAIEQDELDKPVEYRTVKQLSGLQAMFGQGFTKTYGALSFYFATEPVFDVFTLIGSSHIAVDVSQVPVTKHQELKGALEFQQPKVTAPVPPQSTSGTCSHNGACMEIGQLKGLEKFGGPERLSKVLTLPAAREKFNHMTKREKLRAKDAVKGGGTFCEVYDRITSVCCDSDSDVQQQLVCAVIAPCVGSQFVIGAGTISERP